MTLAYHPEAQFRHRMDEFGVHHFEEPWSERELDVIRLLAEGLSNREIAEKLFLSPETIKWYNKRIYDKLGVNSRTQAAVKAREAGLLDPKKRGQSPISPPGRLRLPAQLTKFIGREREMAAVMELLKRGRLVSLTGPGGIGKTRLALQVAEAVAGHYPHGATFVDLAPTLDPEHVPSAIAQKLGLVEQPGQPLSATLGRFFENKQALLVLDNYEHVLPAAPLVSELLGAAPRLTVLVTSREVLNLSGEYEYPVPPLAVPDLAHPDSLTDLPHVESVALFLQRAQVARPEFKLTADNAPAVAAICARLDGLPLALELAAARLRLFSPEQLLARLDSRLELLKGGPRDRPARQRTLRDTIDWSYHLLEEAEQRLFWRLGVFVGGRTIAAIEAICGPGLTIDPLDGLESLLGKSLLYQQESPAFEPRFIMLETIHEYARERLAESGEEREIRDRHLAYFLGLAEEMAPGYRRQGQIRLLATTKAEKGNLRAAFDRAFESDLIEEAARLISALQYYWYYQDSPIEGFRWFMRVLPEIESIPQKYQSQLLFGAGTLAWTNGDLALSRQFYLKALALARELGDRRAEAWSLTVLSANADQVDTFGVNWRRSEEALATMRALNDKPGEALALNNQGELAKLAGDNKLARQKYEAALEVSHETGEIIRESMLLANLSMIAYNEGEYRWATDLALIALHQFLKSGTWQGIISVLGNLAGPLGMLGQPVKGARLLGASASLFAGMGAAEQPSDYEQVAKYTAAARDQLGEAAFQAAWAEGQAMTLDEAVDYALEELD